MSETRLCKYAKALKHCYKELSNHIILAELNEYIILCCNMDHYLLFWRGAAIITRGGAHIIKGGVGQYQRGVLPNQTHQLIHRCCYLGHLVISKGIWGGILETMKCHSVLVLYSYNYSCNALPGVSLTELLCATVSPVA